MKLIRNKKAYWYKVVLVALMLFLIMPADILLAEQSDDQGLELNEAVNLALQNSESVKKAVKEISRTNELRNYAGSMLEFVPIGHIGNPAVEMAYSNALSSELTYQISRKSLTAEEDTVILDTCKRYWAVLKAQEKLKAAEAEIEAVQCQLQNSRVAEQVGVSLAPNLSPRQLSMASEAQYSGAQASLESARNELEKAYNSLNKAIGSNTKEKPILKDTLIYEPYELKDINHAVNRALSQSPLIWQAEQTVNMKDLLKDIVIYSSAGQYQPAEARRLEVEQAQLDVSSTKKLLEEAVRSIYYQIRGMEEMYTGAMEALKVAEENLRVKKIMCEVGMATKAEVKAEEQKLADAQYQISELIYNHSYLKLACEKPWAAQLGSL
jgi:outer membrane protein TolC